jgi:hypothetical protein
MGDAMEIEDLWVGGWCAGDLAAGADVGVEPAQIELVDDGAIARTW